MLEQLILRNQELDLPASGCGLVDVVHISCRFTSERQIPQKRFEVLDKGLAYGAVKKLCV